MPQNELILREKLAIQRTIMANQTTFLAFVRTGLYFFVAGLSVHNLLGLPEQFWAAWIFYIGACILLVFGTVNFFIQKKKIQESKKHIGNVVWKNEN
jgi:putative membrane protein